MGLFRKKPDLVEALTFEEFVQYGLDNPDTPPNVVRGYPWSFKLQVFTQEEFDKMYEADRSEKIVKICAGCGQQVVATPDNQSPTCSDCLRRRASV